MFLLSFLVFLLQRYTFQADYPNPKLVNHPFFIDLTFPFPSQPKSFPLSGSICEIIAIFVAELRKQDE